MGNIFFRGVLIDGYTSLKRTESKREITALNFRGLFYNCNFLNILYSNIFIQYCSYPEVCGYHYVTSVQIRSFLWSVLSCIRTEYRKIRIRKDSVFGHFSRSVYFQSAYGPTSGSLTFYMCEMARSGKVNQLT